MNDGESSPAPRWRRHLTGRWAVAALLALYYALAMSAVATKGTTCDEVAHLTGGTSYWKHHEFALNPENGNLPQRWGALPLLLDEQAAMDRSDPDYRASDVFAYGSRWMCAGRERGDDMLLRARAMMALVGAALGFVVHAWSRRLWGDRGAMLSLLAYVLDPTMLAHGPLVTSDTTAALMLLLAMGSLWRLFRELSPANVLRAGASAGGLAIAKFSCVLLVPMALVLAGLRLLHPAPLRVGSWDDAREIRGKAARAAAIAAALAVAALLAAIVTWAAFDFRFAAVGDAADAAGIAFHPGSFDEMLATDPPFAGFIAAARERRLLPEAWLYGLGHVLRYSEGRRAFFLGEIDVHGWALFFPVAVLVKTPLGLLGLWAVAAIAALASLRALGSRAERRAGLVRVGITLAPLAVLLVIYWTAAMATALNVGHRHVIVTQPIAAILLGSLAPAARRWRWIGGVAAGLVALLAVESFAAWPSYLSFFHRAAGGSRNGYRLLVDSSLDWGQDLPALARWLDANAAAGPDRPRVYFSYFGNDCPSAYGIDATPLHSFAPRWDPPPVLPQPRLSGGIYCVSASMLQLYSVTRSEPERAERLYALVVALQAELEAASPGQAAIIRARYTPEQWEQLADSASRMILDRLCSRLRAREPSHRVEDSILVYELTDGDVAEALAPLPTGHARR